jgi:2-octaprenyl-6-methoxyphenol hydroxylase
MTLALALHKQGISAEIFEARERGAGLKDRRILALSQGAKQTLGWLGAWDDIDATPIHTIHVSQRGRAGRTMIRAEEERVPALGYVASLHDIYKSLDNKILAAAIPYHDNTRVESVTAEAQWANFMAAGEHQRAQLVAYAEGAIDSAVNSAAEISNHDYGQHALTAIVTIRDAAPNMAWERFTNEGPVALLPFGQAFALVQTGTPGKVAELREMSATKFLAQLQTHFGQRLIFTGAGPRYSFPLGLRYREEVVKARQVWLGNAAQTLHPVAGQGFNLGLRDVRELSRVLATAQDAGAAVVLNRYARKRRLDRRSTIGFTDALVRLFSNNNPVLGQVRGAGLLGLDLLPGARRFVAKRMMFGAHAWM